MAWDTAKIVPFRYKNGTQSWRVTGTIAGKRLRKCFRRRADADAYLGALLSNYVPSPSVSYAPKMTSLTDGQLREAELAFTKLPGGDLTRAVENHVARKSKILDLSLFDAIEDFEAERIRAGTRIVSAETATYRLHRWRRGLLIKQTCEISLADAEAWIFETSVAPRTQKDRRQILGQFCKWAVRKNFLEENPVEKIPAIKIERELPAILEPGSVKNLMAAAETTRGGLMAGYFATTLFSGVRPQEATRLADSDFHFDAPHSLIEISPRVAKVRQCRRVVLDDGLRFYLQTRPAPLVRFRKRAFNEIRELAGLIHQWQHDILRHTFASYHYALNQNIASLTYTMGNSERVLFQSYIRPTSLADAKAFFRVLPDLHAKSVA